jgi:sulfate transport system substrate-binding protein
MILARSVLHRRWRVLGPPLFLAGLFLYSVWSWLPFPHRAAPPRIVVFYGFSILGEVMTDAVFPAFGEEWRARTGEEVEFVSAFAGSGTVRNQLAMGVPADVALLSLELDALELAEAGVLRPGSWKELPHGGVVNRSPIVILVREGNPLGIRGFADLARPGVSVVHPDPLTSGAANWALLAEYGAGTRSGGAAEGEALTLGLWRNVDAQAGSARAARTQFDQGFGDALVTYEQELLRDRELGKLAGDIVYPASTIATEHTLVLVEKNVRPRERELVEAFVAFLWSERAQRLFVEHGFRSIEEPRNAAHPSFGSVADLFTVEDLGGWQRAEQEIVGRIWRERVMGSLGR